MSRPRTRTRQEFARRVERATGLLRPIRQRIADRYRAAKVKVAASL